MLRNNSYPISTFAASIDKQSNADHDLSDRKWNRATINKKLVIFPTWNNRNTLLLTIFNKK